jgi:phospholipid/cholesterol/gamma-HCH transport system permease protein
MLATKGEIGRVMDAASCSIEVAEKDGKLRIAAAGVWEVEFLAEADRKLREAAAKSAKEARIDLSGIEALDTAGAWLLYRTLKRLRDAGAKAEFEGAQEQHQALIERVAEGDRQQELERRHPNLLLEVVNRTGRATLMGLENLGGLLSFLGVTVVTGARSLAQPSRVRFTALFVQMERTGLNALPIVGLLSFLIGVVLAYQGADQLRRFGAEIFTVNLVGVSVLREMGILLAAIIVAGRSGSAFTAQIGTMQVNEEVDALRAMGLDPIEVLVLPRVMALILVMPLLTVYSDPWASAAARSCRGRRSTSPLPSSPSGFVTRCRCGRSGSA